jgi:hypothetical protein
MATQFQDELDDLPVTKAAAAPVKSAATMEEEDDPKASMKKTSASASAAPAAGDDEDLTVEFGDRELMKKTGLLERLRPEKGKVVRFALLTDFVKAQMAFTHYIDKKGTYRCMVDKLKRTPIHKCFTCGKVAIDDPQKGFKKECVCPTSIFGDPDAEGFCCKKLKEASERQFVALAVYYKNAGTEDGGLEKGVALDWEIRYVQLTQANFRAISRLIEEEVVDPSGQTRPGTVNDMDIVMSHADKAFGYEFHKKAPRPRFRQNPELLAEVKEKLKPYLDGVKLKNRLGRTVTDLEFKALLSSLAAGSEDAKLGDVESL